ncbi:MAG: diguanylate cyclase [Phycisphaerales bacterium]|nr:diguanylate cyclase [Phycisphaerales bacterium]MCB9862146.1 diguanylate cyclase [Phycisphaerales bacterium]
MRQLGKRLSGLQFRTTLILTTTVLAASGLTGALYLRTTTDLVLDHTRSRSRDLAQALALASATDVAKRDSESLVRIAEGMLLGSEICYVLYTDVSGHVLASYQNGTGNITPFLIKGSENISVEPIDEPRIIVHREYGARVDVVYPVLLPVPSSEQTDGPKPTIGYVRLGLSITDAEKALTMLAKNVMGLSVIITLLMVPLGYQIVRNVVSPLKSIREAARAIARNEPFVHVALKRSDEIGELGESFNAMADQILATHSKLTQLNSELEDRVSKRTQALEDANQRLREMASRDSLTGLYNRRHFNDLLAQLFAESSRYDTNLSCVMIDLDNFKHVNDSLGHQAGDDLLRLTSNVIHRSIREADVAVRYGGDEFCVLMPQTAPAEARASAERILECFCRDIERDMPSASVATLSIGVASRQGSEPASPDALVQLADEALYLAKAGGKNRITVVQPVCDSPFQGGGI